MRIDPAAMPHVATVDARFQSYNVEMVEVTGGRFWTPYAVMLATGERYAERAPVDLANTKLRRLATALGPAYVRVSGTWANTTWFADADPAPAHPPEGFKAVLSHAQWRGVVDFARAVDARIVASMPIGAGTRDADGAWRGAVARRWLEFTASIGGEIAAAEFMNEPNAPEIGGAPHGYDAAAFARDFVAFQALLREVSPATLILGPSSIGDQPRDAPGSETPGSGAPLAAWRLMEKIAPALDGVSYHHYGAASRRCAADTWWPQTRTQDALSEEWLATTDRSLAVYRDLRDAFAPGKPLWLTETADAVCGGNPWAATFLDTFRYLDQLGRLARAGVQVVIHNTLAASDYGLLDETTFEPRPNYWAALLWRRLMGEDVLDPGIVPQSYLRLYAHRCRNRPDAVTLLAINTDRKRDLTLTLPAPAQRYTLSAADLQSRKVLLNGEVLKAGTDGALPEFAPLDCAAGPLILAPASATFLVVAIASRR